MYYPRLFLKRYITFLISHYDMEMDCYSTVIVTCTVPPQPGKAFIFVHTTITVSLASFIKIANHD